LFLSTVQAPPVPVAGDKFDVMDSLGEISVPMLAIVGTEDVMTAVKYAQFLVEKMQNASIEIIEGGTHSVFAQYPEEVNAAIDKLLRKLV
jgi:pimeloyl-ACP methyl ester carboxylesterase